jgi:hypothetical protein
VEELTRRLQRETRDTGRVTVTDSDHLGTLRAMMSERLRAIIGIRNTLPALCRVRATSL